MNNKSLFQVVFVSRRRIVEVLGVSDSMSHTMYKTETVSWTAWTVKGVGEAGFD